jgi:hypothetical protein
MASTVNDTAFLMAMSRLAFNHTGNQTHLQSRNVVQNALCQYAMGYDAIDQVLWVCGLHCTLKNELQEKLRAAGIHHGYMDKSFIYCEVRRDTIEIILLIPRGNITGIWDRRQTTTVGDQLIPRGNITGIWDRRQTTTVGETVVNIINQSSDEGVFPSAFKTSSVIPIQRMPK